MHNTGVSATYAVILPNGERHELPLAFFWYYSVLGLIRVSTKSERLARVRRGLRAWPAGVALRFERRQRPPATDAGRIGNAWRRLMDSTAAEDEMWALYDSLERQYGIDPIRAA